MSVDEFGNVGADIQVCINAIFDFTMSDDEIKKYLSIINKKIDFPCLTSCNDRYQLCFFNSDRPLLEISFIGVSKKEALSKARTMKSLFNNDFDLNFIFKRRLLNV